MASFTLHLCTWNIKGVLLEKTEATDIFEKGKIEKGRVFSEPVGGALAEPLHGEGAPKNGKSTEE